MIIVDSDIIMQQERLGVILRLMSVWSSPLCDLSVCPLLTTAVFKISFLIVHVVMMFIYLQQIL